ncbi:beta-galactosidase BglB [Gracilibacillus sp. Marseille-QA3620]
MIRDHLGLNKDVINQSIELLMDNLVGIKDSRGEYLLNFDGLIVDDKSWHVWNWPQGVGLYGIYKYWKKTGDPKAEVILKQWYEERFKEGLPPKNINTMAPFLTLACLYEDTQNEKYLPHLIEWAEWVMHDMPRTQEDGLQHMTYGPENKEQLWDDTLMMTVLPLAKIGKTLNRQEYIEEAKKQFLIHIKYLADRNTGLWYHGWTFDGNHHYSGALWGRGNCWITIAIPEVIEILDLQEGDFFRDFLVSTLKRQIDALVKYQTESGLWHTLINDPDSYLETSSSAGFAFGILKAISCRLIGSEYKVYALRAVQGILNEINEEGTLQKVSVGTGMGDTLDFYKEIRITAMPYGQSLAILCLAEILDAIDCG